MKKEIRKPLLITAITVVAILYRDFSNMDLPFLVFSFLAAVAGLILDTRGRCLYVVALLPFCRGIPYSEIILIIMAVEVLTKVFIQRIVPRSLISPLWGAIGILFAIEILDYIYFRVDSIEIIYLALYMAFTTYVVVSKAYYGMETEYVCFYGVSVVLAVISVVAREINEVGLEEIFAYGVRFGSNLDGSVSTNFNSNELGLYCAVAASLFLVLHYCRKKNIFFVIAALISVMGFVSISRTYLVVTVIAWLLYLFVSARRPARLAFNISVLMLIVMLTGKALPEFTRWITKYFVQRFQSSGTRASLMSEYFNIVFSDPWGTWFGFSENYQIAMNKTTMEAVHNGLQEVLVCWGLIGFLVFALWTVGIYRTARKAHGSRDGRKMILWLPAMVFWMYIQALQLITMHNYLTIMLLTVIIFSIYEGDSNGEEAGIHPGRRFTQIRVRR